MKINERYEIGIVFVEILDDGSTGDVYDCLAELEKEKPHSDYQIGFVVIDTETGLVPDNCNDWNDSQIEAINDYNENIADSETINVKYYEIWMSKHTKKGRQNETGMCILGTREPSIREAERFLAEDIVFTFKCTNVDSVCEISQEEAYSSYSMDDLDRLIPIYGITEKGRPLMDLKFSYDHNGAKITKAYRTIMDFTDSVESGEITASMLMCGPVNAIFFENLFQTKSFSAVQELYDHCVAIMR